MKLKAKLFSISRHLILGVILDLDKYIFLWQTCFIWDVILYSSEYGINKEH